MKTRTILTAAILALICAMPAMVRAQGGPGMPPPGAPPPGGPMGGPPTMQSMGLSGPPVLPPPFTMALRTANLTADQQAKMSQILDSDRTNSMAAMRQLHSIHEQIASKLLSTGSVSEADLNPLAKQAAEIDQEMQQRALTTALRIRAILTPDQIARMSQFRAQMISINAQIQKLMHAPDDSEPAH